MFTDFCNKENAQKRVCARAHIQIEIEKIINKNGKKRRKIE